MHQRKIQPCVEFQPKMFNLNLTRNQTKFGNILGKKLKNFQKMCHENTSKARELF